MSPQTCKSLMDLHPRELKGMIRDVPTLPIIYQELFAKMKDPDVAVPEIAEIISRDQALAAKVLHLVNSAFYGYAKQIKTISRAVVILGFQAVRSASLAIGVFDYFKDEKSTGEVDMAGFWIHSIAVATICKVLAMEYLQNQQEEAFVVGLLHDTGKLVEKRYFPEDFDEVCTAAREQHLSWYDCEKMLFNLNHATIGKAMFRAWSFPPSVVEAVHCHHEPGSATTHSQLAALVHVADYLSYRLDYGAPGAHPPRDCDPAALRILGLELDETGEFEAQIRAEIENALEIMQLVE